MNSPSALAEPSLEGQGSSLQRVVELHGKWLQKLPEGVRANLSGETFSGASFQGLALPGGLLSSSTWIETDLTEALFTACDMDATDCRQAILNRADLTGVKADDARWSEAWMLGAVLAEVNLNGCLLKAIHGAESRWQDAQLNGCDLTGADLKNAAFHQAKIYDSVLATAQMDGAQMLHARLQLSRLVGVQAVNANFGNAVIQDCDFSQALLAKSRFSRCDLSRSRFYKADLSECDLREAKLNGCDLSRSNLTDARLGNAQLCAADLRGANLRGAKEMTADQLAQAFTDSTTTLPNGTQGPFMKRSGAEKPMR